MKKIWDRQGLTLMEILVALMLIGFVFIMATSVYTTGLRMLNTQRDAAMTTTPTTISLESVTKKIVIGVDATLTDQDVDGNGTQINVRVDQACNGAPRIPPTLTAADDNYWHYRFIVNSL